MTVSDLYHTSCNNIVGGDRSMKTLLGCETCIYSYLAIDGAGYYCQQPDYKKIECVKTKLAHYVAQLEPNRSSNASSDQTVICNLCEAEGLSISKDDKPLA